MYCRLTHVIANICSLLLFYMGRLLEEGVILSESCLHLFLQTPLSVAEIAECLRNHNIASDSIRTVEAFSVMSPSGDR